MSVYTPTNKFIFFCFLLFTFHFLLFLPAKWIYWIRSLDRFYGLQTHYHGLTLSQPIYTTLSPYFFNSSFLSITLVLSLCICPLSILYTFLTGNCQLQLHHISTIAIVVVSSQVTFHPYSLSHHYHVHRFSLMSFIRGDHLLLSMSVCQHKVLYDLVIFSDFLHGVRRQ